MKKFLLLPILFWVSGLSTFAQKAPEKGDIITSMTMVGLEAIAPTDLRYGQKLRNGYWMGPSVDLFGFVNLGYQQGYYEKPDSGSTLYQKGKRYSFNLNVPFPLFRNRTFNLVPQIGFGLYSHEGTDPYHAESGSGDGGFGFSLNAGLNVLLGPVKIGAKMYGQAGYNNPGSIFKGFTGVPAISVGITPVKNLLNPRVFSHHGMATWRENYSRSVNTSSKTEEIYRDNFGGSIERTTTTTTVKETWNQVFGERDARIMDVQPFFFAGPRIQSSIVNLDTKAFPSAGLMAGWRIGTLYLAGYYDQGDFYFKEEWKRPDATDPANLKANRIGRMDGCFRNSRRWGLEGGLELITYLVKSQFLDQTPFSGRTSYYGLILRGGYVKQTNGTLAFNSPTGSADLDHYLATPSYDGLKNDVRTAPKEVAGANFGLSGTIGAAALNMDYFYFGKNKVLSHWEFSLAYHYPIVRLLKSGYVLVRQYQLNRKLRKARAAASSSSTH